MNLELFKINVINKLKTLVLPCNSAIIFNIDNTILKNGKPVIEIIEIINFSRKLNIDTIIITSRNGDDDTINNTINELKTNNINYNFVYFHKINKKSSISDYKKNCRKNIIERGYNIIMCIGYNHHDIYGEYTINPIKVPDIGSKMKSFLEIIYEDDEKENI